MRSRNSELDWNIRPLEDELGEALRAELLGWPGVRVRPLMGTLAFFSGRRMLGCYVNRALAKKKPEWLNRSGEPPFVWIRLRPSDETRALRRSGVKTCRLGFQGWVEIMLETRACLEEAVRWLGTAYERPPRFSPKRSVKKRGQSLERRRVR